jgi:hypothetical protein
MKSLTLTQLDLLKELEYAVRHNPYGVRITPFVLGGQDGSHHCSTLAALCRKGFATRRKHVFFGDCTCKCGPEAMFGHRCRGSFTYGITDEGRALIELRKVGGKG